MIVLFCVLTNNLQNNWIILKHTIHKTLLEIIQYIIEFQKKSYWSETRVSGEIVDEWNTINPMLTHVSYKFNKTTIIDSNKIGSAENY